jgi:glucose-1-phosphate thymidylyltransferase
MRLPDPGASLTPEQVRAADAGLKAMMPVNGRPFLDYVLSALADAGILEVALIVAPDHEALLRYYTVDAPPRRLTLRFVVQQEAVGTADAVLAAEAWAGGQPFLTMNADNLYPSCDLRDLAGLPGPGLLAFDAGDLVRTANIPPERIKAFAIIEVNADGELSRIAEKPAEVPREAPLVSMNCWHFDHRIFAACRDVPRSVRGEFELPEAVGLAVKRGVRFTVVRAKGTVLDLSRRADAVELARRLERVAVQP